LSRIFRLHILQNNTPLSPQRFHSTGTQSV
jgi:hypothetical protein